MQQISAKLDCVCSHEHRMPFRRYAAEVSRLKAAFNKEAQADVEAMKEAVERYKHMFEETQERVERLNMQKQLLIKQVSR